MLSRVLNRKVPLTNKQLKKISTSLSFTTEENEEYLSSLIEERNDPKNIWGLEDFFEETELKKFRLVQEWQYLAIIELINLPDFELTSEYISKKLGLKKSIAKASIENLRKLGILKMKNGKWASTIGYQGLLEKNLFAIAMKERQRQILHKAAEDVRALSDESFEQCSFSMALDDSLVEETKLKIHEFKKRLAKDLHKKSKSKNSVYEFSVSFFPLTKK